MSPAALSALMFLLEEGIKLEPSIVAELQSLFSKPDPTVADWQALRARVNSLTYEHYDPTFSDPTAASTTDAPSAQPATITAAVANPPAATSSAALPTVTAPATNPPPASSLSTVSQADTNTAAPLTATKPDATTAAPENVAIPPTIPTSATEINALVNNATPDQLKALYEAGFHLSNAVNARWALPPKT